MKNYISQCFKMAQMYLHNFVSFSTYGSYSYRNMKILLILLVLLWRNANDIEELFHKLPDIFFKVAVEKML